MKYKFNKKRKYKKFCAIYCGTSINPQFKRLRDSDIVVGTPGQVLDHISRNTIDLSGVKHVVLDEADRMLDMGFLPEPEKIAGELVDELESAVEDLKEVQGGLKD